MKTLKPWRSFADQLQQLQDRGLQVENPAAALDYLERLGYYRLSGYWYPLRAIDKAASVAQGKAVRLDIAYLLGQHDPRAHENPACLHGNFTKKVITKGPDAGKTQHEVWLAKYHSMLHRARKEPFVAHHLQHYGALPIWAAVEVWDFGLLSKLFAGMRHTDQQTIASLYGASTGLAFAQWLRSLNFIRNVSAHHSRLWNINVLERSDIPAGWPTQLDNARPFFYFGLMQQLLSVICPNSSWGQRFKSLLVNDLPVIANQSISSTELGAFPGWEGWALWT